VLDVPPVVAACEAVDARLVVDASQAAGWLPLDVSGVDVLVAHGYKWLMSPRGATFCYLSPRLREGLRPLNASWYAAEDVMGSFYGTRMDLARDARRFDQSPAWFSLVGAAAALEVIEQIDVPVIHRHDVALANRFRAGLGLPPGDSAIVIADHPGAASALASAGIRAAVRADRVRLSFHAYNTEADVDRALEALLGPPATGTATGNRTASGSPGSGVGAFDDAVRGGADPEIVEAEAALRAAQLAGDVDALDELIGDDLLFAGPDGRLASKADDLAAYRNGTVRFELHEPAELSVRRLGDDVAVASLATLLRVRVNDEPVEAVHRYTRVWSRRDGRWRVVGGQVAPMPGSAAGPPDPGVDVEP
jgi:ketosteroid isomerase-like protein